MAATSYVLAQATPGPSALFMNGPTFNVTLSGPHGAITVPAGIDTESTITGVDLALLQQVGAQPTTASVPIQTPSGGATDQIYMVRIMDGSDNLMAGLPGVLAESLPDNGQGSPRVLIGRDVLGEDELVYDGPDGDWELLAGQAVPPPATSPDTSFLESLGIAAAGSLLALALYRASQRR